MESKIVGKYGHSYEKKCPYNSGITLLRMIAMFGIIIFHILGNGGVINSVTDTFVVWPINILNMMVASSVNIFAIITGYVYSGRQTKNTKIAKLVIESTTCSVLITVIFVCLSKTINVKKIIVNCFPFLELRHWYIAYYAILFFLIPVLNAFCVDENRIKLNKICGVMFGFLCVLPSMVNRDLFSTLHGYSVFWLIVCYLFGACIKLNMIKLVKVKRILWVAGYILNIIIATLIGILVQTFCGKTMMEAGLFRYTSPFVVANAVILVILFASKPYAFGARNLVKVLSKNSFGVYIIHCHPLIMDNLIVGHFGFVLGDSWWFIIVLVLVFSLAIYVVCALLFSIVQSGLKRLYATIRTMVVSDKIHKLVCRLWNE